MNATWRAGVICSMLAAPLQAQTPETAPAVTAAAQPAATAVSQQRFRVRTMEGVLESAVQHGAQSVSNQMRLVSPDIALFSGPARARGFRLDSYGAFFAVDVPSLHRSVTWSVRTLSQSNADLTRALQSIRRMVQTQPDTRAKSELEQSLRLLELQVGPTYVRPPITNAIVTASSTTPPDPLPDGAADRPLQAQADQPGSDPVMEGVPAVMANPSAAYTEAVQRAIIDAMLEYGATLNLGPEEWLTVAARENSDTILSGDLTEVVTITLRVRAADLAALHAGRLTRDEVQKRVEVREF